MPLPLARARHLIGGHTTRIVVALVVGAVVAVTLILTLPGHTKDRSGPRTLSASYDRYSTLFAKGARPPRLTPDPDRNSVELGVRFSADVAGDVGGLRLYRATGETAAHPATLWSPDGQALAHLRFPARTTGGWQYARFDAPVALDAGAVYTVSYHSSTGYASTQQYFRRAYTSGHLTVPADSPTSPNGVYREGDAATVPTDTWLASNYWIDVLFQPGTGGGAPSSGVLAQPAPPTTSTTPSAPAPASRTSTAPSPGTSVPGSSDSRRPKATTRSTTPASAVGGPVAPSSSLPPAALAHGSSYVRPGQAGYTGSRSSLTVVPDQKIPAGCTWDSGLKLLNCHGNVTLDHMYVKGAVDAYENLTITNSVIEATPSSSIVVNERGDDSNSCAITHSTLVFLNGGHLPNGLDNWGTPAISDDNQCGHGDYEYNDISGTPDGIQTAAYAAVIRYNYIHDLALLGSPPNETHNDGIQLFGCTKCDISYNYFDIGWDGVHQNSCFFESDGNPGDSITFNGNYLSGGGFAFRNIIGTNMTVVGNTFAPVPNQFGLTLTSSSASFRAWSGNVTTSGAPVPQPRP